ncbi:MFS transporter [Paenibacillus roseipurpureus]|uniref:MFS transporter n=1 Tax=Paenibacillus roseopurpureus TaxID=2918901 RepID=A0AA96LS28_9BACL|nr:MFS transporter [Paenibacillus sp. MBLB1832]WNR43690.1 MFS transporter [Paenibacillus sp. MBLB1832]
MKHSVLNMLKPKKKMSTYRKSLLVATFEGFPAVIIYQLLGGPFLTGYLIYLGATSTEIGFILAITTVVNIVQIAMAVVMQKFRNRKRMLIIFGSMHRVLWSSVGLIPFVLPHEYWVVTYIILYTAAHLGNAAAGIVWTSLISDAVPGPIRGRYFGLRNTILGGVSSLALFAGGQILDRYPGEQGFNYIFMIVSVCVVLNIVAYFLYPNPPFEPSTASNPVGMIRKPLMDRAFLKAIIFLASFLFVQGLTVPLFSYVMLKLMNISYGTVSYITVVHTLVMMASYYVWGNLNARFSAQTLLLWSLPIIALACLLWGAIAFIPAVVVLYAVHIVLGIGLGGFNQMVFAFTIGDTPKSERPMYIATYSAITGFAAFLGPVAGGKIYALIANEPLWVQVYGVSTLVGAILLLLGLTIGRFVLRAQIRSDISI